MSTRSVPSSRHRTSRIATALFACGVLSSANLLAQSLPTCTTAQAPLFSYRWGGLVHDAFSLADGRTWLVEDGGRIRYSATGDFLTPGAWSFQTTPFEARDQLLRIFTVPSGGRAWAVGEGGRVLGSVNGGTTWTCLWHEPDPLEPNGDAILFDVHFRDGNNGALLGLHQLKFTTDGGVNWYDATVLNGSTTVNLANVELYAMDFLQVGSSFVGLATAEPGLVFKTTDGMVWSQVVDLNTCASTTCNLPGVNYEPWDIAFVPGTDLVHAEAIVVGGVGNHCGLIYSTNDAGATWQREIHECLAPGANCTAANGYGTPGQQRYTYFETIYGVGTFTDRGAVATGYGGQQLVRDVSTCAATTLCPTTSCSIVWRDRSNFESPCLPLAGHPTQPLTGAQTSGASNNGTAWIVGEFGAVRKSTSGTQNAGEVYVDHTPSEQDRSQDVCFMDANRGFRVGQIARVSETVDGGYHWNVVSAGVPGDTNPCHGARLNAIAWNGGTRMMTVGTVSPNGYPLIIAGVIGTSTSTWTTVATTSMPTNAAGKALFEVDSAGGSNWFAGGQDKLLLKTTSGGSTWDNVDVTGVASTTPFDIQGLAFDSATSGFIAVILNPETPNEEGRIYRTTNAADPTPTWTDVTGSIASSDHYVALMDIASNGTDACAVGIVRENNNTEVGLVLVWDATSGTFKRDNSSVTRLPYCILDGEFFDSNPHTRRFDPNDTHIGSILNDVEFVPGTSNVWIGGDCGRMLFRENGAWREVKSQTSLHITGMSFPTTSSGFVSGRGRGVASVTGF